MSRINPWKSLQITSYFSRVGHLLELADIFLFLKVFSGQNGRLRFQSVNFVPKFCCLKFLKKFKEVFTGLHYLLSVRALSSAFSIL